MEVTAVSGTHRFAVHDRSLTAVAVTLTADAWGAEHSLLNLAGPLRDRGVLMTLAAPAGGDFERRWRALGLPFEPLPPQARVGLRTPDDHRFVGAAALLRQVPDALALSRRLVALFRQHDVVHSNALLTHLDCVAAARLAGRPVVVELHDVVPPGPGRLALDGVVLGASAAVAVSSVVRDQLNRPARARTTTIGQGVDVGRFSPGPADPAVRSRMTADPGALLVAVVGRVDPVKRIENVVRAVAHARRRGVDVHLAVVGQPSLDAGDYQEGLRRQAQELLPGAHRFTGAVDDVPAAVRAADAVVSACEVEAFGLTLLEALACGTPVVVPSTAGAVDFVVDGENGVVYDPTDPDAFADGLVRLLADPPVLANAAAAASASVVRGYSAHDRADRFAALFGALAAARGWSRR